MLSWLRTVPLHRVHISVLTLGEIDKGIETLEESDGRRSRLTKFRTQLEADFSGRVLRLDEETVRLWGVLAGQYRRSLGGEVHVVDAMLAATARRNRLYVATRNVKDFAALGVTVFNPWVDDPADFPLGA